MMAYEAGGILLLSLGIFVLDLLTPPGWAVWLLYLVPLLTMLKSTRVRDPIYFALLFSALIVLGFVLSPAGMAVALDLLNRGFGLAVMWVFVLILVNRRQLRDGIVMALTERRQAEESRETAVAERRHVEERLAVSTLRLEGIVQSAMDAIITVNDEQRIVLFNKAAERMFGCAAEEANDTSLERFIPQRFREAHRQYVHSFGHTNVTTRKMGALGSITGIRANGKEFPIEAAISQIAVDGRKFYTVILRDITERKQADEALRASEERFKAFMDNSPAVAFIKDENGRYVYVSKPFELRFGKPAEECRGKTDGELWPPDVALRFQEGDREALAAVHPIEHVEAVPGAEGELQYWLVLKFPVKDASDRRYVGGVAIEITERKKLEDQLRRTERLAELGTLASGMAHEIGTPMNVILGRAEHLLQRTTDERVKNGLEIIISQIERITKIMNQLLTFARRRPLERRSMDLRRTIADCLEVVQERIARYGIQVDTIFAPNLPSVYADPDQMSQVLLNLIINAVHAMPEGGTLRIGLECIEKNVRLTVADTGCGIPAEDLPKVFNPFFTTKEVGKGTGLGLTVVHGIVREHDGSIEVESQPGVGTTFTIVLATAPAPDSHSTPVYRDWGISRHSPPAHPYREPHKPNH